MSDHLAFGVWSPDEATFRASWITAGILLDQPGYQFAPGYPGIELTATQGWPGLIVQTPEVRDPNDPMVILTPAVMIDGWHCNVYVRGPLVAEMTYGLAQHDAEGNLLPIFDRTWATNIFQLTWVEADPATKYPAGYGNAAGVRYADARDFRSPSNTRQ